NPAFGLGAATPAPVTGVLAWLGAAAAWHATDRQKTRRHERMRRQLSLRVDGVDASAADIRKRVEFQPDTIPLDHRNVAARATLETFAPVDPGVERRKRTFQRLHFTNPAARVGIGEPQFAIRIFKLQRI